MLDSILARIAKKALGLPMSSPTAMILKSRECAGVGVISLVVDYVQANAAYLPNALNDMGPLGQSTKALLKVEQKCIRGMPTMGTELQDKRFLKFVKSYHIMNRLSLIRSSGLQLRSLDGTSLTALGPDIDRLLNTVKLGEISVPSRVYIPLMEIGLLGLDQCTTLEGKKECFIAASQLQYDTIERIRPRHKLEINRLPLLLSKDHDTVGTKTAFDHESLADLPIQQRLVASPLATGRSRDDSQNEQQRFLWEWLQRDLSKKCPHEEERGLHQEQSRRGALSVTMSERRDTLPP